jgi:carbonic anhydrase
LRKNSLEIHGWYYDIGQGTIEEYEPHTNVFLPLDALEAEVAQVS